MIDALLAPFDYAYMQNAIWVTALVGGTCGLLSAFLMLKGWSLIGDALSHAVVPGVAIAYIIGLPFSLGALASGFLASLSILFLKRHTKLRQDANIGIIFTGFFGFGLFIASLSPTSVDLQTITFGNILATTPSDRVQLVVICLGTLGIIAVTWRALMICFFDPVQAETVGIRTHSLTNLFFALLAACTVAAMQTVGAFLVVALVITPGATAYLLTDRFERLLLLATGLGAGTSAIGAYGSYFLDMPPGPFIITLQGALFACAFLFAPTHGYLAALRLRKSPL